MNIMLTRLKSAVALLLMVIVAASCSDSFEKNNTIGNRGEVVFDYTIEGSNSRALASDSEMAIDDVYLVFFDKDNESYVTHIPATNTEFQLKFKLNDKLVEGTQYKVLVTGYMDNYIEEGSNFDAFMSTREDWTYTIFKENMLTSITTQIITPDKLPYGGILIGSSDQEIGMADKEVLFTCPSLDTEKMTGVSVKFTRGVSRIDIVNKVPSQLNIVKAKVCNYRNEGFLFHNDLAAGESISGVFIDDGYVTVNPASPAVILGDKNEQTLNASLYALTNLVPYPEQTDTETTCVLLAGYYKDSKKLTYYRANITEYEGPQVLRRNYVYKIVIVGVEKEGPTEEDEALYDTGVLLDFFVGDEWENDCGDLDIDDDGNFLNVSRTFVTTTSRKGNTETIKVIANPKENWDIRWAKDEERHFEWKKINNNTFEVFNLEDNNGYNSNYNIIEVFVKDTELVKKITLAQSSIHDDKPLLTVDDKKGEFYLFIDGDTKVKDMIVKTGSEYVGWTASYEGDEDFIKSFTTEGDDGASLHIEFDESPISLGMQRKGSITVKRKEGNVPDVVVEFVKEPYFDVFHTYPYKTPSKELVLEGFYPAIIYNPDAKMSQTLQLRDPSKDIDFTTSISRVDAERGVLTGPTTKPNTSSEDDEVLAGSYVVIINKEKIRDVYEFEISSEDFNPDNELFISTESDLKNSVNFNNKGDGAKNKLKLSSRFTFYIYYYYMGPDDKDIVGNITITARAKDNEGYWPGEIQTIPIRITSSAKLGSPIIENGDYKVKLADRNYGAPIGGKALNFNNLMPNHPDQTKENEKFIGQDLNFSNYTGSDKDLINQEVINICSKFAKENYSETDSQELTKWIPFTFGPPIIRDVNDENKIKLIVSNLGSQGKYLENHLTFSKGRTIIYSTHPDSDGKFVATYLPNQKKTDSYFSTIYYGRAKMGMYDQFQFNGFISETFRENPDFYTGHKGFTNAKSVLLRCMKFIGKL